MSCAVYWPALDTGASICIVDGIPLTEPNCTERPVECGVRFNPLLPSWSVLIPVHVMNLSMQVLVTIRISALECLMERCFAIKCMASMIFPST